MGSLQTTALLRDKITEELRSQIRVRQSDRPVRMESERTLAEILKVSRLTLRAAIKNLVDEGLLLPRPGSGTYIVPRTRWSGMHLLVASDLKPKDPFFQEFLSGLTHRLGREGVPLHTIRSQTEIGGNETSPLIILGLQDRATIARVRKSYSHIVAVQSYPDSLGITQVHFDDYKIGHDAARILVEHGHTNLLHLAGPNRYPSASERRRGFVHGAKAHGASATIFEAKMNWRGGDELGDKVLDELRRAEPPTAVFAANDWMALGLLHRLKELGVRFPQQLSIIGCDDIHLAEEVYPGLATFRWDIDYLITEVFTVLDAQVARECAAAKRILLPAEFVARASLVAREP